MDKTAKTFSKISYAPKMNKLHRFKMSWVWVNDDENVIFGWLINFSNFLWTKFEEHSIENVLIF